jgi:hypothetical protein
MAYKRAGGRLGVGGVMPVPLARVGRRGHGRRRAPLRRPMARHGRCATGGSAPPGAAHLPRTARMSPRRRCAMTGGHSGTSACVPDAGTARTAGGRRGRARRRGGARLGVPGAFVFR